MQGIVAIAARLVRVTQRAYTRKWAFLGLFGVAFLGSVSLLASLDLLPETPAVAPQVSIAASAIAVPPVTAPASEEPVKIEVSLIGLSATISNPATTKAETLDALLLKGAVRYPTSAKLGETGNVVLFGHSSYLPVVNNPAYKTFNGIQKLAAGNVITVTSGTRTYTYRVRSVAKESAAENAAIPLAVSGKVLTLVTCNSFATKSDRFVVTADFVDSHLVGS